MNTKTNMDLPGTLEELNTKAKTIRSLRNCNPLNIRRTADHWQGMRMVQSDRAFCQFDTMAYGYRAAFKLLSRYVRTYHLKSVREIVTRWAPEEENDTRSYIRSVCAFGHLGGNEIINASDRKQMCALVGAMAHVESGVAADESEVAEGWALYERKEEEDKG
jgi:hypothetical protein